MSDTTKREEQQRILRELYLVRSAGFDQAERYYANGMISRRTWEVFCYLWVWSAPRFYGFPGARQDAFVKAHGMAALGNKIQRTKKRAAKLAKRGAP